MAGVSTVATAPAACSSSSRRAMAITSSPTPISSTNANSSPGLAPYSGTAARYSPKSSGRAAEIVAVRLKSPVPAVPGASPAVLSISAAVLTTGKRMNTPIASGRVLASR